MPVSSWHGVDSIRLTQYYMKSSSAKNFDEQDIDRAKRVHSCKCFCHIYLWAVHHIIVLFCALLYMCGFYKVQTVLIADNNSCLIWHNSTFRACALFFCSHYKQLNSDMESTTFLMIFVQELETLMNSLWRET